MDIDSVTRAEAMKYKLRKEAFVSNLSGSSLTDINIVTLVAASAILLWTALARRALFSDSDTAIQYVIDFLLNVCAILFAFTAYASAPVFLNLVLVAPAVLLLLPLEPSSKARGTNNNRNAQSSRAAGSGDQPEGNVHANPPSTLSQQDATTQPGSLITRPFLTNYRGAMLIATSLAILAVDFHIFPRRFAKVETWGTSLMDLGVGSFVFSAGVVSARAVIKEGQSQRRGTELMGRILKAFRHSLPLLVLGIARLISVKNLDYAEHVTEYGVHWNFFFTLALLPPFVEAVDCCLALVRSATSGRVSQSQSVRYDLVALLITITYEVVLGNTTLLSFILISPRTPNSSLLTKNREGVFSFFGYLAVFLAGRSTGILVCQFQTFSGASKKVDKRTSITGWELQKVALERNRVILPQLTVRATVYAGLYFLVTNVYFTNLTVSRRLANLPYVLWIVAYNNAQLLLFAIIESAGPKFVFTRATSNSKERNRAKSENEDIPLASMVASPIMKAFNKNGLAIFLIANLLTGLVNLTVNTLDTGSAGAMAVLIMYAAAVTAFAVGMDVMGLKFKM